MGQRNKLRKLEGKDLVISVFLVPVIEDHDEAKSVISGTLTGLFFKSTSGAQKCARGGLVRHNSRLEYDHQSFLQVGFGLSALWALGLKKQDRVQQYI